MSGSRGRIAARIAAAAAVAGLSTAGFVTAAHADSPAPITGTLGKLAVDPNGAAEAVGVGVTDEHSKDHAPVTAGLLTLKTDSAGTLYVYCIDFFHNTSEGTVYDKGVWSTGTVGANAPQVLWVLDHGFKQGQDPDSLYGPKGLNLPNWTTGDDNEWAEAAAATQAALWHYSDHMTLDSNAPGGTHKSDYDNVKALYDYLTGSANTGETEQTTSVQLAPTTLSGHPGDVLGPVTITTGASAMIDLKSGSSSVTIAKDKTGTPLTGELGNGGKFWVKIASSATSPGDATVTASTPAAPVGEVFLAKDSPDDTQKLILSSSVPASLAVNWSTSTSTSTPTPTPSSATPTESATPTGGGLAHTGASSTPYVVGGAIVLLLLGGGLMFYVRKARGRHQS